MDTLTIFGLGYVGREVAAAAPEKDYSIIGIDTNQDLISKIKRGEELDHIDFKSVTTDGKPYLNTSDIIVVAVPTPVDDQEMVDLGALKNITKIVATTEFEKAPLFVVESTIPPGTISDVVVPIFEEAGKLIGEEIYVAHAPERINPGTEWDVREIPRVVGAETKKGQEKARKFYDEIIEADVHTADSTGIAEASKIIENAYRDVNIAFVNEIALALDNLGIDADAALNAAETKPFGFQRFYPGIGVGGHCIPIDPYFLIRKSDSEGFNNRFLKYAREINDSMPAHVAQKTVKELNSNEILPKNATVTILGAAFKSNVEDTRNSPYFDLKSELADYGIVVNTYDPFVPELSTVESPYTEADGIVLVTEHEEFQKMDFDRLASVGVEIFVDGRNVFSPEEIEQAGMSYVGVGR